METLLLLAPWPLGGLLVWAALVENRAFRVALDLFAVAVAVIAVLVFHAR